MTTSSRLVWSLLLAAASVAGSGCGEATTDSATDPNHELHASLRQEIRPTDGDGWFGNAYEKGVAVLSYDPPGGHFRVFYVIDRLSTSAVDPTDVDPTDGVPDFVNRVGAAAEQTYDSTVIRRGFRQPLDDSKYHDRPDFGGDGRFDIYLRMSGKGSDGYRVTEVCTDGMDGTSGRCSGYFVMNPTFKDSSYPTELDGIRVLTSHELFHAIQDAYSSGQWRTFSESTAVWNELQVFPKTAGSEGTWRDYLRFIRAFQNEPERPFDKSMGSGPAGAYAYGAALFIEYLSERFGPKLIREIWEGCEAGPTGQLRNFLDVLDVTLVSRYGVTLASAWTEFTRWNLLTGKLADGKRGYKDAAEYPEVRLEPTLTAWGDTQVALDGLSARYFKFAPTLTERTRVRVRLDDLNAARPVAAAYVVLAGTSVPGQEQPLSVEGKELELAPGDSLLLVVASPVRGSVARTVKMTIAPLPASAPPPTEVTASGCSFSAGPVASRHGAVALLLSLSLLLLLRRRLGLL